jgi:predicted O-methyltransferase YrrM
MSNSANGTTKAAGTHGAPYAGWASEGAAQPRPNLCGRWAEWLDRWLPNFLRRIIRSFRHPHGSYYSPVPSLREVRRDEAAIFDLPPTVRTLPGLNLHEEEQLALLEELAAYYAEQPFPRHKETGSLYYFENEYFSYSDALFLYALMRYARPARIIEIGSGYSSCAMLDVNERFFDGRIACSFIDPDLGRLRSLATCESLAIVQTIEKRIQDVDLQMFRELSAGDMLFVDSSHVSKIGSDLNRILFEIVPLLRSGVLIHFHDVFWPFEYPRRWVYQGRAFNEAYLLRAFLQYNTDFKIIAFNSYLEAFHRDRLGRLMPLCLNRAGRSLWLKRM